MTRASLWLGRSLEMIAKFVSSISANFLASFVRPTSADTTTTLSPSIARSRKCCANIGSAVMWSTGPSKKPCTWPACRSIVSTRSMPAVCISDATRRAVMGSRGADFLSWREYGYHGMTAVTRSAEPSFAASAMISSSIRFALTGLLQDCTRKTSPPRTDSSKRA